MLYLIILIKQVTKPYSFPSLPANVQILLMITSQYVTDTTQAH